MRNDIYNKINIVGQEVPLQPLTDETSLRKEYGYLAWEFYFYRARLMGRDFILLSHRGDSNFWVIRKPKAYAIVGRQLEDKLGLPVVFLMEGLQTVERDRLIERGVYFIVEEKFVYMPFMVLNRKMTEKKPVKKLSFYAQYLLMYHLQRESIDGRRIKDLISFFPYNYVRLTLTVQELVRAGFVEIRRDERRFYLLSFLYKGRDLWDKALPLLTSPVRTEFYCDGIKKGVTLPVAGINALAGYSYLAEEDTLCYAVEKRELDSFIKDGVFKGRNEVEGPVRIEVWSYPPVVDCVRNRPYVDRLSLSLSIREEERDSRVEDQAEKMLKSFSFEKRIGYKDGESYPFTEDE